jgi:hypothetical protein
MSPIDIIADHEYYIVEMYHWPDIEVLDWCVEQFGKESGARWTFKFPNFYFADSKDHLMFTLRWA